MKNRHYNVNMRLVAKQANVSIATVSRFVNQPEKLSETMRERVGEAMQELGYIPNELAKTLLTGVSRVIGLVLPSVTNPFFAELAMSIEEKARAKGDMILLVSSHDDPAMERSAVSILLAYRVAAMIVCRSSDVDLYSNVDVPVVCFENPVDKCQATIHVDNESGGYLAYRHLLRCGCQRILHLRGPKRFGATEERMQGFLRGYDETPVAERPVLDIHQMSSDFTVSESDAELDAIADLVSYDGIFAFNDIIAASLLRVLHRRQVAVPDQVKVIGFDGSYFSQMTAPPLSTVSQHVDVIASRCMAAVWQFRESGKLEDGFSPTYVVPTELIERDSTRVSNVPQLRGEN